MKRTMLLTLLALALSLPIAGAASAHGRSGPRLPTLHPGHDRPCKDLRGVLFGLCVSYCEALRCDEHGGRHACDTLLRLYERASHGEAPPCEDVEEPPAEPVCGDGVVNQTGEECDDGNNVNCDGCTFDCHEEFCGDGILCDNEECEPGDECSVNTFCNQDCTCPPPADPNPTPACGDSAAPECGGSCPSGRICVSRDTFCECIGSTE